MNTFSRCWQCASRYSRVQHLQKAHTQNVKPSDQYDAKLLRRVPFPRHYTSSLRSRSTFNPPHQQRPRHIVPSQQQRYSTISSSSTVPRVCSPRSTPLPWTFTIRPSSSSSPSRTTSTHPVRSFSTTIPRPSKPSRPINLWHRRRPQRKQRALEEFNKAHGRKSVEQEAHHKRKRKFGFLARLRTPGGRKVLKRRKEKGRWRLAHR